MSETLKFNEYCRTKLGEIFRVVGINEFDRNIFYDKHGARYYRDEIIKHSENIIDLIEVGDYVNGIKVLATTRFNEDEIGICVYKDNEDMHCTILKKENIKSIVTKEKFEQVEYRIEEEK